MQTKRFFLGCLSFSLACFSATKTLAAPGPAAHAATESATSTVGHVTKNGETTPAPHSSEPLEPAKVVFFLRQGKTIKPEQPVNVILTQKLATILTERRASESDKDVKIDAVLIAHSLIGGFPDQINKVRLVFQRPGSAMADQIDVTTGDVKAYGAGAIDVASLLNSLDLTPIDFNASAAAGASLHVAEGPLLDKRLLLLSRITALKSKGTSVKPFMDLFDNIEREAPTGSETAVAKDVAFLAEKLEEQENLLKEAQLPAVQSRPGVYGSTRKFGAWAAEILSPQTYIERLHKKFEHWQAQGLDVSTYTAKLAQAEKLANDSDPSKKREAWPIIQELQRVHR